METDNEEERKRRVPFLLFHGAGRAAGVGTIGVGQTDLEEVRFANARAALRWSSRHSPAAAVIDFDSTGREGLAFARLLRDQGYQNPIFAIGSRVELIATLSSALHLTLAGIYEKPVDPNQLGSDIHSRVLADQALRAGGHPSGTMPAHAIEAAAGTIAKAPKRRVKAGLLLLAALLAAALLYASKTASTRSGTAGAGVQGTSGAAQLDGALGAPSSGLSLQVVDAKGRVFYSQAEDTALAPASTLKLIVAASAYATLGERFRFTTALGSEHAPRNGVLDGNLILKGEGDPSLTSAHLAAGIAELRRRGVRHIRGSVVVVTAPFSLPEQNPYWAKSDLASYYAAGSSAVSLDGNIANGVPVREIALAAGGTVDRMLARAGIRVDSPARTASAAGAGWIAWRHQSAPLHSLVHEMLANSNNLSAEQLLRALGQHTYGAATPESGIRAEFDILQRWQINSSGLHIVDGSGLGEPNRATARTLAELLTHVQHSSTGSLFYESLPLLGSEGTVANRVLAERGRVRAKDGHLHNANALAGYINTEHHGRFAFAFIANGANISNTRFEHVQNRVIDILTRY